MNLSEQHYPTMTIEDRTGALAGNGRCLPALSSGLCGLCDGPLLQSDLMPSASIACRAEQFIADLVEAIPHDNIDIKTA
jgi:hypothetical protein